MPKKTKKEKIIAQLRRKLKTTQIVASQKREMGSGKLDTEARKLDNLKIKNTFQLPNVSLQNPTSNIPPLASSSYATSDLRKTFFLAVFAISFEVMLYWLWR